MRKIRDVLRLKASGLSKRKIAASIGVSAAVGLSVWTVPCFRQEIERRYRNQSVGYGAGVTGRAISQ
jgi:FixJ family two-component response regulator